jgi:hypothetical protein
MMHQNRQMDMARASSLTVEPRLPADFAQRVLQIAQKKSCRRQFCKQIAATAAIILAITSIRLVTLTRSLHDSVHYDAGGIENPPSQMRSSDDVLAYQLEWSRVPRSAGDYLLPNTIALTRFTSAYTDALWQDDAALNYNN